MVGLATWMAGRGSCTSCDEPPLDSAPNSRHTGPRMNAAEFISKWRGVRLSERAASHEHFLDLCELLG